MAGPGQSCVDVNAVFPGNEVDVIAHSMQSFHVSIEDFDFELVLDGHDDFDCIECSMTHEEAAQESSRCLRCDQFGYGIFKGGRVEKW